VNLCELQESCSKYSDGKHKRKPHHVRVTIPCVGFIASDCPMYIYWESWNDRPISCNIEEVRKKKEKLGIK